MAFHTNLYGYEAFYISHPIFKILLAFSRNNHLAISAGLLGAVLGEL